MRRLDPIDCETKFDKLRTFMRLQVQSKIEIAMILNQITILYYDSGFCINIYNMKSLTQSSLKITKTKEVEVPHAFKDNIPFYKKDLRENLCEIIMNF